MRTIIIKSAAISAIGRKVKFPMSKAAPVNLLNRDCPSRAMNSAMEKAVPDCDLKAPPMKLSTTGKVAPTPKPISIIAIYATVRLLPRKVKPRTPARATTRYRYSVPRSLSFARIFPKGSLPASIPIVNQVIARVAAALSAPHTLVR